MIAEGNDFENLGVAGTFTAFAGTKSLNAGTLGWVSSGRPQTSGKDLAVGITESTRKYPQYPQINIIIKKSYSRSMR
jgi:hypothetical protein